MSSGSIIGIGCDLVQVDRIAGLLGKGRDQFLKRVLTPAELLVFEQRSSRSEIRGCLFVASRFAGKEAFSKAMGCGLGQQFSFQDLSILNGASGCPLIEYSDKLLAWLNDLNAVAHISLSDEQSMVMATVVLSKK